MKKLFLFLLVSLASSFSFLCGMEGPVPTYQLDEASEGKVSCFAQELSDQCEAKQFDGEQLWDNIKQLPVVIICNIIENKSGFVEKLAFASVIREELAKRNVLQKDISDSERKNNRSYISWLNKIIKKDGESYIELTINNESNEKHTIMGSEFDFALGTPIKKWNESFEYEHNFEWKFNDFRVSHCVLVSRNDPFLSFYEIPPNKTQKIRLSLPPQVFTTGVGIHKLEVVEDGKNVNGYRNSKSKLMIAEWIKYGNLYLKMEVGNRIFNFLHPLKMSYQGEPCFQVKKSNNELQTAYTTSQIIRRYNSGFTIRCSVVNGGISENPLGICVEDNLQEIIEPLCKPYRALSEKESVCFVILVIDNTSESSLMLFDHGVNFIRDCYYTQCYPRCSYKILPKKRSKIRVNLSDEPHTQAISRSLFIVHKKQGFIINILRSPERAELRLKGSKDNIKVLTIRSNEDTARCYGVSFMITHPEGNTISLTNLKFGLVSEGALAEDLHPPAKKSKHTNLKEEE